METLIGWKDIAYSPEAEQALQNLKKGEVLAVRMKAVKNGKIQIEFAEKISTPNPVRSALGLLNKSDKRFNFSSGARRSWETAEPADLKALFGFELPEGESHSEILKVLPSVDGNVFRLQVIEKLESELNENQMEYKDNYLKRAGKEGNYFYTPEGHRVAVIVNLVTAPIGTEITHTYLKGAFASSEQVLSNVTPQQIKAVV